jgi:homoserine kinase
VKVAARTVRPGPVPGPGPGRAAGGLRAGTAVRVRVPATSANLGPGFDSLGLALALYDEIDVEITASGTVVEVSGHGEAGLPCDERHLVVQALRAGLAAVGAESPGVRLVSRNAIPHRRGLGSSAAAVVGGLIAARGCLAEPGMLDDASVLEVATRFEGHPDNAAAALLGGFTISWCEAVGPGTPNSSPRAVRLDPHPDLVAVVCVPTRELSTAEARAMLPDQVPHADAAFNAARCALLVEAITRRPELLMPATEDRLHQDHRGPAMPHTAALVQRLRAAGVPAVISGAGPGVLALGVGDRLAATVEGVVHDPDAADGGGWDAVPLSIDTKGTQVTTEGVRQV